MNQSCPTADHVEAFAFGTLEPDQVDTLSEHLDSCGTCRTAYESILSNTDPIVAGLRAGGANEGDSRVRALAAKLQRIPYEQPLSPPEPDVETSAVAEETVDFDPLHVWLGIPAEEQPADHYRLLGLRRFEHSLEVIESAADRQMMHLRSFQAGKRAQFAQDVLNRVSTARVCLLNPDKKKAYDQQLKEEAGTSQTEAPAKIDLPIEPPQTIDELRHLVTSLGLLSDTKFDKYLAKLPPDEKPTNAETLARRLVADGRLTKHQAATLYQGKWQKLVLGDYTLLARIGGGGMGDVYRALHRRMGVVRAIKVIKPELVDSPDTVRRFHREVLAAAQLTHQHIVMAYDASEDQNRHYLVMEYIDGPDLGSLVKQKGPLSVPRTIDFIIQAARGLAHAHSKGTIHRDVKPGNLLLGSDGIVKVSDLGLARLDPDKSDVDEQNHLTTSDGKILGTVDFMAPEQADNTHTADERADIYSLGCTLFRLLTGQSPYGKGSTLNRMMAHRNAPIPKIRDKRPEISEQLDELFSRLVAKRPEDRPQSMEEVEQLLEACLEACLEGGEVPLASPQPVPVGTSAAAAQVRPLPLEKPLAAVVQPRINTQAAARQRLNLRKLIRSRAGITGMAIGLALLLFGGAALTIMLTIQTPEGEFIVQVDGEIAPDVKIELKQGGDVIEVASAKNGWTISVNQGNYDLEVQGGNDQFQLNKYTASVTRDGKEIVRLSRKEMPPLPPVVDPQRYSGSNNALAFSGSDSYVELPFAYHGDHPLTIEAIVTDSVSFREAGEVQMYVSNVTSPWGEGPPLGACSLYRHRTAIWFGVRRGGGQHIVPFDTTETKRRRLAGTYDGKKLRLFIDGELVNERDFSGFRKATDCLPILIGASWNPNKTRNNFAKCTIDEVRISNFARYTEDYTPQERLEADEHTLALYHFDEGAGDVLKDSSGNKHHGKIHGAQWVRVGEASASSDSEAQGSEHRDPTAADPDQIVEVRRFEGHSALITRHEVDPTDSYLVSFGNNQARVWDLKSGKLRHRIQLGNGANGLAISPEGKSFTATITGTGVGESKNDAELLCFDLQTGEQLWRAACDTGPAIGAAFSSGGERLLSHGIPEWNPNHGVCVWDAKNGRRLWHRDFTYGFWALKDKAVLAGNEDGKELHLLDTSTGETLGVLAQTHDETLFCKQVIFSKAGDLAAAGTSQGSIVVWDLKAQRQIQRHLVSGSRVWPIAFVENGTKILLRSDDEIVQLVQLDNGQVHTRFDGNCEFGWSVDVLKSEQRAIVGSRDNKISVWDLKSGEKIYECQADAPCVDIFSLLHDGKQLVSSEKWPAKQERDHTLRLWRLPERVWPENNRTAQEIVDDGALLLMNFEEEHFATDDDGQLWVRDLSGNGNHGRCDKVQYTPDGKAGGGLECNSGQLKIGNKLLNRRSDYTVFGYLATDSADGTQLNFFSDFDADDDASFELTARPVLGRLFVRAGDSGMATALVPKSKFFLTVRLEDGTSDSRRLTVFVDGEQSGYDLPMQSSAEVGFAAFASKLHGIIDEVAIFDRALSDYEIRTLREHVESGKPLPTPQVTDSSSTDSSTQ